MNKNETISCTKHGWRMIGLLLIGAMMPLIISCGMKQEKKQSRQTEQSVAKEKNPPSPMERSSSIYKDDIYEDEETTSALHPEPHEYAGMPEFPGGMGAFMRYVADSLNYPDSARKARIQGRVIVQFLVTKTGEITDVKVARSVEASLDAEAIRLVKAMPNWTPGVKDGKKSMLSI